MCIFDELEIHDICFLGLIFFDGFESPMHVMHLSIIFAYSWSSQNPGNVIRKKSILAEISGN